MAEEKEQKDEPTDQLIKLGPNLICNDHYFVYKSGTEVTCKKCPMGYPIGPGTNVRDGHLYVHGEFVI